jgi:uncharacterized Zn finger protein (UPF0148 family)
MAEVVVEKAVCEKCGMDVRDGTAFCYNCGAAVGSVPEASVVEPAEPETPDEKLSRAAAERKKARVGLRRATTEYTWEGTDDTRWVLLSGVAVTVIVMIIVLLMVFWK